jgi:hypothetical protein
MRNSMAITLIAVSFFAAAPGFAEDAPKDEPVVVLAAGDALGLSLWDETAPPAKQAPAPEPAPAPPAAPER